jgi:hypothetical protein
MPQFDPPEPGPFAFRELTMPAPPCDEARILTLPRFRRDIDPERAPGRQQPDSEKKPDAEKRE